MFRVILIVAAVVLFALLALNVITTNFFRWETGALALFAASFLFPDDWSPWARRS